MTNLISHPSLPFTFVDPDVIDMDFDAVVPQAVLDHLAVLARERQERDTPAKTKTRTKSDRTTPDQRPTMFETKGKQQ